MMLSFVLLLVSIAAAPGSNIKVTGTNLAETQVARFALRGFVRDRQGQGISGATVVAVLGEMHVSVTTDANGAFRFSLPAGRYRVEVTAPGFFSSIPADVTVASRQAAEVAIVLASAHVDPHRVPELVPPPRPVVIYKKEAPPPIAIAPSPPPVVMYESSAPPPPPAPAPAPTPPPAPPAPPSASGDQGPTATPKVDPADGRQTANALYWNEWLEGGEHERLRWVPETPADVAPSEAPLTTLVIDLSLADLSPLGSGGVAAAAAAAELPAALSREAHVRILPVVLGDALELEDRGWRRLQVNFEKMQTTSVKLPASSPIDDAGFRNLARTASVLDKPEWSPILLPVRGVRRGCAAVALSVWDESLSHPIDQQFFPVAVGPVKCGPMPGGKGLSAALLRRWGSDSGDYDAALHVFEMPKSRFGTSAVFVARGSPRPRVWKLGRSLSDLPEAMGPDLGRARDAEPYAVKEASRTLMTELFVPGDPAAEKSLEALRQFRGAPGKTIYARIVTADGRNFPLPLGLIDVGGGVPLGSVATIVTPFPRDSAGGSRAGCINQRVMISDNDKFDGIQPRPSSGLLVGSEKAIVYFEEKTSDRVALVLLGHHGEATAQLVFDNPPRPITPSFLTRRFDNSVGFFMVCGLATAPTKRDMTTWLERFGDHGIDAAVASPFEIEADTAEQFLTAVQQVLAATPAASSISVAELYAAAIKRMDPKKAWEAFEYVVIGDGSIRICGEGS